MRVFLSYSSKDRELARKVRSVLVQEGLDVWDHGLEIMPGDNWAEEIGQALKESEAMVVLLTPSALESDVVRWEIDYALGNPAYAQRLISVLVGRPEQIPEEKIPWILRRLKMITLPEPNGDVEAIKQIAQALTEAS
jgi:hypothetical protein